MGRKKVKLQYILNGSTRRGTFQKRSHALMKKADDLSTLCGTKACIVIYGEGESVPQVYPFHAEAVDILNRFKDMPEHKQYKKMTDQECFLLQRISKLQDQVQKSRSECQEREIRYLLHKAMLGNFPGPMGLSIEDLTNVGWKVEVLLKSIGDSIAKIRGHPPVYQPSPVMAPTPNVTDGMDIIGPTAINLDQASYLHQEGRLKMVSSGGGAIGSLVHDSFNGVCDGATSNIGFNDDEMIQPFDLGVESGSPWGGSNP